MQRDSISSRGSLQSSAKDSRLSQGEDENPAISQGESICASEKEVKEIRRCRSVQYAIWGFFSDYCDNSTIHGIKYLGEQQRPLIERIWWTIIFFASIFMCSNLIWSSWMEWEQSPVIITFASKSSPIWKIPFPAVTICPDIKVKAEYLNFTKTYNYLFNDLDGNLTEEEIHRFDVVYQTCLPNPPRFLSNISDITFNGTFIETLKEIAPKEEDLFASCMGAANKPNCVRLVPILTEEGICFTQNMLNASELYYPIALHTGYEYPVHEHQTKFWTLEDGYKKYAPMKSYPSRALPTDSVIGTHYLLQISKKDIDPLCQSSLQGFKITLHSPVDIPRVTKEFFHVSANQEMTLTVTPNMVTTSEGLRDYDPLRRQCYFNHERKLQFFRIYTQKNCELECLSLYTKKMCGCVKFSMPRDASTPICGNDLSNCYKHAEFQILKMEMEDNISKDIEKWHCNCLPACTSIGYDVEQSFTNVDFKDVLERLQFRLQYPKSFLASYDTVNVQIIFKDNHFLPSRRSELNTLLGFIANCGGLLGLFMGVSLLSIIEIVYFFSIRLYNNFRMRMNHLATETEIDSKKLSKDTKEN